MTISSSTALSLLEDTLEYSRQRNYKGYDKADGISSRLRRAIPFNNKWVNIAFQESAKRAPINIRPYLLVEKRRNFKGIALFACANLNAWKCTGNSKYKKEAEKLLDWLCTNRNPEYAGFCGGHQHPIQTLDRFIDPNSPGIVGTSYAVRALLNGQEIKHEYHQVATSARRFVIEDLNYKEINEGAQILYKPGDLGESYILNANALGARLLIDIHENTGRNEIASGAKNILRYVSSQQSDEGGWKYSDPETASNLSMDNYHNGFIIESFLDYRNVMDSSSFSNTLNRATKFYRNELFEENGAPCWDEENRYPRDIHAAAQGIIVFNKCNNVDFSSRILQWAMNNLYAGDGQFYYQQGKYIDKNYTLMRWCQAWMAYAISEYLRVKNE